MSNPGKTCTDFVALGTTRAGRERLVWVRDELGLSLPWDRENTPRELNQRDFRIREWVIENPTLHREKTLNFELSFHSSESPRHRTGNLEFQSSW